MVSNLGIPAYQGYLRDDCVTIAEALRRMASKRTFDQESQDLAALIVFSLRRLEEGVEQTASAWEKRDYYLKADRFRMQWEWLEDTIYALESALLLGQWDKVPEIMAVLFKILFKFLIILAPINPMLSEEIYLNMFKPHAASLKIDKIQSIHLQNWPEYDENEIDLDLEEKMFF